jgi:iron uptake system EfeUOB component EfeO/EfeM
VPVARGVKTIVVAAVTLAAVAILAQASLPGSAGARAPLRPCSSYPVPGSRAPAHAKLPRQLASKYAILRRPQRPIDRLRRDQLNSSLSAAGVILSGTRFLGKAAYGGRIYLVPAQHLLAFRLAPLRCLPADQRALEQELRPALRREFRHRALCIEVLGGNGGSPSCVSASGDPDALLYMGGTPGFGLVPNGVRDVTVTYQTAHSRTVPVHHNFFVIIAPKQVAPPCGVQWLDAGGTVLKAPAGCSYVLAETNQLDVYRAYVAGKLSTLRSQIAALSTAIGSGSLAQAQSAWLTAHLTWLAIGQDDGAYGCFGALGGDIDGLAAGHPLGTSDPSFTGFHKIEFDLWSQHDLSVAARDTATLQTQLAKLMRTPLSTYLPATATGIGNWLLRPHEVIEDAIRDSLTGNDDYGSGTDLASLTADVAAVRALLTELSPVLDPVAPGLRRRANGELNSLMSAIASTHPGDTWVSIADLPAGQRQQIDAAADAAAETLAPIPDLITSTGRNAPAD